jgi:hypothetical protein
MIPTASQTMVLTGFSLFQAVSNRGKTVKPLIDMMKLPAVSPFHGFGETQPAKFQ